MVNVAIFDYGAGNIFSLKTSLEKNGAAVDVITSFDQAKDFAGVLLPGVGNFDPAIRSIRDYSATQFKDFVQDKMPVLGICLGMEMFFAKSEEGKEKGLDVFDGEVVLLPDNMKIPHIVCNSLKIKRESKLLDGVDDGAWVYFVHSYRAKPLDDQIVVANADYGISVPAVIENGIYFGTQFHPEKSGKIGSLMIRNFLRVCKQ